MSTETNTTISLRDVKESIAYSERWGSAFVPGLPEMRALVEAVEAAHERGVRLGSCPGCGVNERGPGSLHASDCTFILFRDFGSDAA